MNQERIFHTDGGRDHGTTGTRLASLRVTDVPCRVKKITCSDEGKLTLAIEATATDDNALERVRDLIAIQQGEVLLSLEGVAEAPASDSVQ